MSIINPNPHMALPPPLAQPQLLAPRSAHVRTQVTTAVRSKPKVSRPTRHTPEEQQAAQHQLNLLV